MSLDVYLTFEYVADGEVLDTVQSFSANITHNLVPMAQEAGIYQAVWTPEEIGITRAAELIPHLEAGIARMEADPSHYTRYNASNGWGLYENFLPWLKRYLMACRASPESKVEVSR